MAGTAIHVLMAMSVEAELRVATLNVRGLAARRRQYQLSRLMLERDLDVIAIQETKVEGQDQTDRMVSPFRARYDVCVSHAVGMSAGCALFLKNSIGIVEETVTVSSTGRFIVCDFTYNNKKWRVVCVYAPNKEVERKLLFENLQTFLSCGRIVIMLGDFNCVCNPQDRAKKAAIKDQSATLLCTIVQDCHLEDVGDVLSAEEHFTHFQNESHARLDRAYVSVELMRVCSNYEVKSVSFSDHSLVMFTIGYKQKKTRFNWDVWKLNDLLLKDELFVEAVQDSINKMLAEPQANVIEAWERFKEVTKMKAIERSGVLHRAKKEKEKDLQCQLDFALSLESKMPGKYTKEIRQLKNQLEAIDIEKYRGAVIRARAEKLSLGETPTKRALGDEKRYAKRNEIKAIATDSGIVREATAIEQVFVEYFRGILGRKVKAEEGFEAQFLHLIPKLSDNEREQLEIAIEVSEIEKAIDDLAAGKAPGPDGFGAALYKTFKGVISVALHRVFTEAIRLKVLPGSFKKTHVILIPKTDDPKKLLSVKSYRPISLANTDYKVFMKVLAGRLQRMMKILVGPHQTCGIKGRTINTNVHVARSVLESCDVFGSKVAMLQLDLEKAFDRVNHDILFLILEYVNVGSVILDGVKMAYRECFTSIVINGRLTESFQVTNGVRQGDPISALLFAIYMEPFCMKIISNETIKGYQLMNSEVKMLTYADDIAVFCSDKESVSEVIRHVAYFCKMTGSAVNWDKCLGLWHGSWETTPQNFANMNWSLVPTKYLGVPLQHYKNTDDYWKEICESTREKTRNWGGRELSMFSRATACNWFIVCKVWYVLQFLFMSRANVQKLHRVLAVFVWGSVWERTSRTNLFHSLRNGGLGLAHLFLKQIVSRYIFLRDQCNPFVRTFLQIVLSNKIPDYVVSSMSVKCNLRGYLREVIMAYEILKVRFSMEYLSVVKRKRLYRDLRDVMLPQPIYRSVYQVGAERDVLKRVKMMTVRASAKTFFFQLHSGTLPVKPWLQEKGFFVPWSMDCLICKKPETVNHIFLDCWDAVFLWDILQRTLKKDLPITPHGIRFLAVENEDGVPYDMFMLLVLHSVWRTRMAVRHVDKDARCAHEYFTESIVYIRDVLSSREERPEWVSLLNVLATMKQF